MATKPKPPGRKGLAISAHPLSADELVRGIFQISKDDVKRIVAKRPGRKKK
ncbi:MAG: hypothetical protein ABSH22_15605 [Tepidisphaeraceae bacterium]|jgi:hypothetical protein